VLGVVVDGLVGGEQAGSGGAGLAAARVRRVPGEGTAGDLGRRLPVQFEFDEDQLLLRQAVRETLAKTRALPEAELWATYLGLGWLEAPPVELAIVPDEVALRTGDGIVVRSAAEGTAERLDTFDLGLRAVPKAAARVSGGQGRGGPRAADRLAGC
jgi:hypothetical protein